jgi:nitric oxide synthase oxygenase domain/subunit
MLRSIFGFLASCLMIPRFSSRCIGWLFWPSCYLRLSRRSVFKVDSYLSATCQFRISADRAVSGIETSPNVF